MPSSFVTFAYPSFTFKPHSKQSIGSSLIQGSLCNPYACTTFSFTLTVTNTAPMFSALKDSQTLPSIRLTASKTSDTNTTNYQLPLIYDHESPNSVSLSFTPGRLPPFIRYIPSTN